MKVDPRLISGEIPFDELPKPKSNKGVGLSDKETRYCLLFYENIKKGKHKTQRELLTEAGFSPRTAYNPLKKRSCWIFLHGLFARENIRRDRRIHEAQEKLLDEAVPTVERITNLAENAESEQVKLGANRILGEWSGIKVVPDIPAQAIHIGSYEQNITILRQERKIAEENKDEPATISISANIV